MIERTIQRTIPGWTWNGAELPAAKAAFQDMSIGVDGRVWVVPNGFDAAGSGFTMSISSGPEGSAIPPPKPQTMRAPPSGPAAPPPAHYDVFEPSGVFLGEVQAPARVQILARRGDRVWAVAYDDDDVAYVKRYRIAWQ